MFKYEKHGFYGTQPPSSYWLSLLNGSLLLLYKVHFKDNIFYFRALKNRNVMFGYLASRGILPFLAKSELFIKPLNLSFSILSLYSVSNVKLVGCFFIWGVNLWINIWRVNLGLLRVYKSQPNYRHNISCPSHWRGKLVTTHQIPLAPPAAHLFSGLPPLGLLSMHPALSAGDLGLTPVTYWLCVGFLHSGEPHQPIFTLSSQLFMTCGHVCRAPDTSFFSYLPSPPLLPCLLLGSSCSHTSP